MGLVILCFAIVGVSLAYARLAPSDASRWHIDPALAQDPGAGGVMRRIEGPGQDALARFDTAIMGEPRVTRLAGSTETGRITYIARSVVMGFPDYVTVQLDGSDLVVLSRLRFGRSDLGVNRARLERVLERL